MKETEKAEMRTKIIQCHDAKRRISRRGGSHVTCYRKVKELED